MDREDNNKPRSAECVIQIKKRLDRGIAPDAKSSWTIHSVPRNWREVHDNAFDPEMIRIGPFRSRETYHQLQLERSRSDGDVSRTTEGERVSNDREREEDDDGGWMAKAVRLDDLVEAMLILAQKMRACYSESLEYLRDGSYNNDDFVEMMVIDGCFVVELLRLYYDLFHTKNQLPFFVLEKLYELIKKKNTDQQAVPLEVLAVTFFDPLLPGHNAASKLDTKKPKAHLLGVFRSTFLKSVSEKVHKKGKNGVQSRLYSNGSMRGLVLHFATELQEARVQFKKWKGHDLLDIEFGHDTLRVPPLYINHHSISLLLNFIAYEMSVEHPEPFFTNYFMFWDSFVNSPGDIQIFRKHRIINHLGSEKNVAALFMRCREVIYDLDLGSLYDETREVNGYCEQYYESKYSVWWRNLIRERFSSPWTCLSLFAAIVLLLLTTLQTFYTVYPYYQP
ncbi:hypothetical protein EUGRSUZ_F03243 [Eucalyptus grandis]|uniref:Uncharacterized protein n=2 Tax=Eucalyptus grandis TaxID=71139 RepID=A0ACC3KKE0_EUCGR|nr:hypothetical protein EUGRSUZ_F03243 [Eucalyptus grandis]